MRILPPFSQYRLDFRGHRLGAIHAALRRGQAPYDYVHIDHKKYYQRHYPSTPADLQRWSQYLKRHYPEP